MLVAVGYSKSYWHTWQKYVRAFCLMWPHVMLTLTLSWTIYPTGSCSSINIDVDEICNSHILIFYPHFSLRINSPFFPKNIGLLIKTTEFAKFYKMGIHEIKPGKYHFLKAKYTHLLSLGTRPFLRLLGIVWKIVSVQNGHFLPIQKRQLSVLKDGGVTNQPCLGVVQWISGIAHSISSESVKQCIKAGKGASSSP